MTQRRVTILGATGSIGRNALKVMAHAPGRFTLEALTAQENVEALTAAALAARPKLAVIGNPAHFAALKQALSGSGIAPAAGEDALLEAARRPVDVTVAAIVGIAGLKPTLAAIEHGGIIALANKECLVAAGELVMRAAAQHGARLIPVDSEHSAIFQVLDAAHPGWVKTVTLTASGGPFREWPLERMRQATPEQAVCHPNWAMGPKISVDSATLMNKGLELIEAQHLFALAPETLAVLIHPESIVHSLVAYCDGSVLAQASVPDMCTPLAYALAWPERMDAPVKPLDLAAVGGLTFSHPDEARFPALKLARQAMAAGGALPAVLNAANEVAVRAFLQGYIGFLDIVKTVEKTLDQADNKPLHGLEDVLAADGAARAFALKETSAEAREDVSGLKPLLRKFASH